MFHERLRLPTWLHALIIYKFIVVANHIAYALHCVLADANHMMGQANYSIRYSVLRIILYYELLRRL